MSEPVDWVRFDWRGRPLALEYQWVGETASAAPTVVFLHEGLGSVAAWKDFPARLCAENGLRGLVYSRYGYGRSTPRPPGERWTPRFLHEQAHEVLPRLLEELGVRRPWLFGHSDGGSIALLHAARFDTSGIVVVAPHLFVEDVAIDRIAQARLAYVEGDLRARLARYHADPDSAFYGWNDIWLDPAFRSWRIDAEIGSISCPVLAIQGTDDEYGTLAQIREVADRLPGTRTCVIPDCGHSPHRDQPAVLAREAGRFIASAADRAR